MITPRALPGHPFGKVSATGFAPPGVRRCDRNASFHQLVRGCRASTPPEGTSRSEPPPRERWPKWVRPAAICRAPRRGTRRTHADEGSRVGRMIQSGGTGTIRSGGSGQRDQVPVVRSPPQVLDAVREQDDPLRLQGLDRASSCVTRTTAPLYVRSAPRISSRLAGSRLLVGSSSRSTLAEETTSVARARRVFSPPESTPRRACPRRPPGEQERAERLADGHEVQVGRGGAHVLQDRAVGGPGSRAPGRSNPA